MPVNLFELLNFVSFVDVARVVTGTGAALIGFWLLLLAIGIVMETVYGKPGMAQLLTAPSDFFLDRRFAKHRELAEKVRAGELFAYRPYGSNKTLYLKHDEYSRLTERDCKRRALRMTQKYDIFFTSSKQMDHFEEAERQAKKEAYIERQKSYRNKRRNYSDNGNRQNNKEFF